MSVSALIENLFMKRSAGKVAIPSRTYKSCLVSDTLFPKVRKSERIKESKMTS